MPDQTDEFRREAAALRAEAAKLRVDADAILNAAAEKEREAQRLELSANEAENYARIHAEQAKPKKEGK